MGKIGNPGSDSGSDIVCLEGNGARPSHYGSGWTTDGTMYTMNTTEVHCVCYNISAYESNCMKSDNPYSGIQEIETSRTLDLNGGNPACNQGGTMIIEIRDRK